MKAGFRQTLPFFRRASATGGLALLRGRGQVGWRDALRISLGRAFAEKFRLFIFIIFGLVFGIAYSIIGRNWVSLGIAFSISFFLTYMSTFPWRVRLIYHKPRPWKIILANGLFGWLIGSFLYAFANFAPILVFIGIDEVERSYKGLLLYALISAWMYPALGFIIAVGEDDSRLKRRAEARAHRMMKYAEQARLAALRAQINPHFFFNALNTIAALIPIAPAEAERAVELLAESLRPVLMRDQPMTTSVQAEVQTAMAYAEMEKLRFGERLIVQMQIEPEIVSAQVPSLCLQPLIENVVRHGASRMPEQFRIDLRAAKCDDSVRVSILGAPVLAFETAEQWCVNEAPRLDGHALQNISLRLSALFGPNASLSVRTDGHYCSLSTMLVPLGKKAKE